MANTLIYPFINPLQLFDPSQIEDDRYLSKDFIDYDFPDTILPWEERIGYCQPWQLSDTFTMQLQTNVGPVNFILKDCETEQVIDTLQLDQIAESENSPGLFIYELSMPLAGYPEGCYYGEVTFGSSPIIFTLRTGELSIKETHENSLYLECSNYEFREDIIFETGIVLSMRVFGTNKFQKTANKSTTYEDQVMNMTALRNVSFRTWKLVIGESYGIPDWLADKISRIISCSSFAIDGKYFTKPQSSELEPTEQDNYPMRGWSVDLRERYNRAAREYENNIPLDGVIAAMISVDSKGFGNSNSGSQTAIIDVI
jgi:hypothetical protein